MPNIEIGASEEAKWLHIISKQIIQLTGTVSAITGGGGGGGGTVISGTPNYISKFNAFGNNLVNSQVFDNGINVMIGSAADNGLDRLQLYDGRFGMISTIPVINFRTTSGFGTSGIAAGINLPLAGIGNFQAYYVPDGKGHTFVRGVVNDLTIDTNGNVGIGTNAPKVRLTVAQPSTGGYPVLGTSSGGLLISGDESGLYGIYSGLNGNDGNGWVQVMRNDSPTAYNYLIQPLGGRVIIGTTADNSVDKLQVFGSAKFSSGGAAYVSITTTASNGLITTINNAPANPSSTISTGANYGYNGDPSNFYGSGLGAPRNGVFDMWWQTGVVNGGGYRWYIGVGEKMTLTNTGNLLINTTTNNGSDKLQVNGYALATGYKTPGGLATQFLKADGSVSTTTTLGANLFGFTNPDSTTFIRINPDNTVDALNASTFRAAIGAMGTVADPLTAFNDTNITLTLGGTPATALLQPVSITVGWTGTLADARIASASIWNNKQDALIGTGFVKSTAGVISYDNTVYVPTTGTGATGTWGINITGSAASLSANLPVNRLNSGTNASATTYWRGDGVWVNPFLSATAVLDFPNTGAESSSDLTIALVGAALGDVVLLGAPSVSVLNNSDYFAWVSSANTVTVRFNNYSAGAKNPASGTFKVTIIK